MEFDLRGGQLDGEELSYVPPAQTTENPIETNLRHDQERESARTTLQDKSNDAAYKSREVQEWPQTKPQPSVGHSDPEAQQFQQEGQEMDQSTDQGQPEQRDTYARARKSDQTETAPPTHGQPAFLETMAQEIDIRGRTDLRLRKLPE